MLYGKLLLSYLEFWNVTSKSEVSSCFTLGMNVLDTLEEDCWDPRFGLRLLQAMCFNNYQFGVFFNLIVFSLIFLLHFCCSSQVKIVVNTFQIEGISEILTLVIN